jgi:hypothetical protein
LKRFIYNSVLQSITGEQQPPVASSPMNPLSKLLATNVQNRAMTPPNSQVISREQFKAALTRLSQDDQFVDLVYKEYLNITK